MTKRKLKKDSELNGRYNLKDNDFMYVQYYPGVGRYYAIINNNSSAQLSLSVEQLRKLLKKFCTDPECLYV
jgi:hypothetical protein